MMKTAFILIGLLTWYGGQSEPEFVGEYLYCSTGTQPLRYDEATKPWIAVDVSRYESGEVQCGDLLYVAFDDSPQWNFFARAYDAGYLDDADLGIIGDVPWHLAKFDGTARGKIVNVTAMEREYSH